MCESLPAPPIDLAGVLPGSPAPPPDPILLNPPGGLPWFADPPGFPCEGDTEGVFPDPPDPVAGDPPPPPPDPPFPPANPDPGPNALPNPPPAEEIDSAEDAEPLLPCGPVPGL